MLKGATSKFVILWNAWIVPIVHLWEVMAKNEKPNFDQKISLFQPSNLSKALILEPRGPQPPYSDIWASLGSLDPDQQQSQNFSLLVLISNQVSQRHGILKGIFERLFWRT